MNKRDIERHERANRFWPGPDCRPNSTQHGATISFQDPHQWRHPWNVAMTYEEADDGSAGEWRATVKPGFVNGRPAFIEMPAWWLAEQVQNGEAKDRDFGINPLTARPYFEAWVFQHDRGERTASRNKGSGGPVRLTNRPAPYLVLKDWRNPAGPGALSAGLDGELHVAAGEGYPKFFETVGVRPVEKGGGLSAINGGTSDFDAQRTREIRAMDIVLVQPREGASLDFKPGDPIGDISTAQIGTNYQSDYYNLHEGRVRLRQTTKYTPLAEDSIQATFGTLLNDGDPQFDELLMATVWMVSPPDAGSDAVPDGSWEPYVQHFVFWNLAHATQAIPPSSVGDESIVFIMPLALGTAQGILNGILSSINGMLAEALAFLRKSGSLKGQFWTT